MSELKAIEMLKQSESYYTRLQHESYGDPDEVAMLQQVIWALRDVRLELEREFDEMQPPGAPAPAAVEQVEDLPF